MKTKKGNGHVYVAEFGRETKVNPNTFVPQGDKFDQIINMLASLQKQLVTTNVKRGNFSQALANNKRNTLGNCWIIDLGASDHMIHDISLFQSYAPSTTRLTVEIADNLF